MPQVRVLRPFANGHHDSIVQPGEVIEVSEDRALALAEHGLVDRIMATKVAPAPSNKMAEPPANKAVSLQPDELPRMPKRRGRPPKVRA